MGPARSYSVTARARSLEENPFDTHRATAYCVGRSRSLVRAAAVCCLRPVGGLRRPQPRRPPRIAPARWFNPVIISEPRIRRTVGQSARTIFAVLFGALCLIVPAAVGAQDGGQSSQETQKQGSFPDASFETTFRKYTPPANTFSPFYSWDATMALDLTVFRKGSGAVEFGGVFQTVGTESLGARVSVGGTGYLLRLGYVSTYSDDFTVSAGIAHLSSHLTRDLDDKTDEQRSKGATIPEVGDASEYNVFYLKGQLKLSRCLFTPEIQAIVEPINFRFDGGRGRYVRPVYLSTRSILWRGHEKSVVVETQHEIGKNSFNYFSALFELYARNQSAGRLAVFVGASPGRNLHVSPNVGGLRDGIAFGIRMRFRG